ncbi:MAG: hypothetical protein ACOYMO_08240 [Phycisphaerales bacterium]
MSDTKKRPYVRALKTYVISQTGEEDRLVRAFTPAEALRHCMPTLEVRPASHDDIIELMAGGCPVETVGIPEQELPAGEAAGLSD